jgi:hypothetical protein
MHVHIDKVIASRLKSARALAAFGGLVIFLHPWKLVIDDGALDASTPVVFSRHADRRSSGPDDNRARADENENGMSAAAGVTNGACDWTRAAPNHHDKSRGVAMNRTECTTKRIEARLPSAAAGRRGTLSRDEPSRRPHCSCPCG